MKLIRSFEFSLIFVLLFYLTQFPVYSQSADLNKQKTAVVEIALQPESPLIITLTGIDDSHERLVTVKFIVQNFSNKEVKAFSVSRHLSGDENIRGLITFISSFDSGDKVDGWDSEAKVNLKPDSKILLAVDYILFADGKSWGKNSRKESEFISGFPEGQKKALSEIKKLIDKLDETALSKLLLSENFEVDASFIDKSRPENWRVGFIAGYKIVLSELRPVYQKKGMGILPSNTETFNDLVKPIRVGM